MSNIKSWTISAASNSAPPPDGAPEGVFPSAINDIIRENMAAVKRWYLDPSWQEIEAPFIRQTNNSFLVSLTATDVFTAGRRLRLMDGGVTIYGDVLSSSMSGANTLVTVSSSNLSSSLSSGSVGFNLVNSAFPYSTGTWTPNIGGTATYNSQTGTYHKIGALVFARGFIDINVIGTGSTTTVDGLPFMSSQIFQVNVGQTIGIATAVVSVFGIGGSGSTGFQLRSRTVAAVADSANAIFASGSRFGFSMWYVTSQ